MIARQPIKRHLGLLLVLIVVGGGLRLWAIGHNSLWFDEVFSRNVAVFSSIPSILRDGVAGDVHPPLYFVLLSAWAHVTGDSEVALRLLSALIALLALPAYYHLGRLLFDERVGLAALALAVLSPLQIYYAQEARQYALSITCAAWLAVGFAAMLRHKRYGWPLYVVVALAGLYTHYFVGLLLAAMHVWFLLDKPARQHWRSWLSADLAIAILFAPQFILFARQAQAVLGGFWIEKPNIAAPIVTVAYLLFGATLPPALVAAAILLTICALVLSGVDVLKRGPASAQAWWLCLAALLIPILLVLIVSLARSSIYLNRSFGLLAPFLLVALAGGIVYSRRPSPMPLFAAGLVILMAVGTLEHMFLPDPAKPPFRQIAADLSTLPDARSVPIVYLHDSAYLPMSYYAPALTENARLVFLEDRSWLFPETWRIFGITRISRPDLARWLVTYRGDLRVIATGNMEPAEQETLENLKAGKLGACQQQTAVDYPPFVTVYRFRCGG